MEERSDSSKASKSDKILSGNSRKNKKRSSRKNSVNMENWCEERPINRNGIPQPAMDYRPMFWQQPTVPQHVQSHHNGQRLFAAMSDPSVCGYSAMPMAYAMEPVSVPQMYPVYQPISRPNYRAFRGRPRRNMAQNHHAAPQGPATMTNGYSSLQEHRSNYSTPPTYQNGDYASLPPTANNDPINNIEELNSEHRRYSDPGLGPAELANNANSEDSDSGESGSSITTIGKNNKLVLSLVEQMTALRETNSQMFKELHETKFELESMKSEMARLKHGASSDYQPGMLSDIVREMREANKALDEAVITKVNAMVDDHNRQRISEFEKLRDQLSKITNEKEDSYRRIAKLEDEVASLKLNANNEGREIAAFEEENLALRRELQEARASRNLAENHAAKCVNALARPLTPVNFQTPCITSTPVRTDLQNSFISNPPSHPGPSTKVLESLSRNSAYDPHKNAKQSQCRRDSTSALPNEINFYRAFQSASPSSSPPSSPSNSSRNDDRDGVAVEIDEEWRWKSATIENYNDRFDEPAGPESFLSNNSVTINSQDANKVKPIYHHESTENIYTEIDENLPVEFEEIDNTERLMIFPTIDENNQSEFNKSGPRKTDNTNGKRFYQVSEKSRRSSSTNSNCSLGSSTSSTETPDVVDERSIEINKADDLTGEEKKCRKRAITEVPDVIVVAGKPVVPKDLCSTRILTSRVLTRATYTTAYI